MAVRDRRPNTRAGGRHGASRLAAMPGRLRNTLLASLLALALAGCGSGDEGTIPPDKSETLISLTQAVQSDVANGDCDAARQHANELADQVRALPTPVEPDVRDALEKAAANLVEQTQDTDQCKSTTGASGPTGTEPTTEPSTTEPTTTETTTEKETTTEEEPATEETTTTEPEAGGAGGGAGGGGAPQAPPEQVPPTGGGPPAGGGGPPAGGGEATGSFDESGGVGPEDRTTP
jgi:hypothetical protein